MPDGMTQGSGRNAYRFAPAAPEESHVYGACCPGWHSAGPHADALRSWIAFMRDHDVERVCSLLPGDDAYADPYHDAFGAENVCRAPLTDHRIADEETLREDVVPFLESAVAADERVVVHCLDGVGRTGQVLAVWLAHDRAYDPIEAIQTVSSMGRLPDDPVRNGDADERDLVELLRAFE